MAGGRVIDGRELQPPEPLELALAALDTLPDGEELELLLYCQRGGRTVQAYHQLKARLQGRLWLLRGGYEAWLSDRVDE